jgi:hypothetical protein
MGHQGDGGICVPQIMGVANPQAGSLADPLDQTLGNSLAERKRTTCILRVFKLQIQLPSIRFFQFFISGILIVVRRVL